MCVNIAPLEKMKKGEKKLNPLAELLLNKIKKKKKTKENKIAEFKRIEELQFLQYLSVIYLSNYLILLFSISASSFSLEGKLPDVFDSQ